MKRRILPEDWMWYLVAAMVLGAVCTIITWPGIFYTDSYGRWFLARNLASLNFAVQDDWLSVPPQLFMAVLYKLTGNYGSFTLVQAVLFFFSAFCAIRFFAEPGEKPGGAGVILTCALFAACPVFYGFAVYLEMGVGCVTALLWLLMLVLGLDAETIRGWKTYVKLLYFLLCCLLYFVMLGFRQNAFTVLPVLFFVLVWAARKAKYWLPVLTHAVAVALCFAVIAALPSVLRFGIRNGSGPMAVGFLWETVSMLGELQDKPEYDDMLDYLGEEGTTRRAVESNIYQSIYGYHQYIPNTVVGQGDNAKRIRKDYLYLMTHEPATYIKVKARFASYALGIAQPLVNVEYYYDRYERMAEFGFSDTPARQAFHNSYMAFQDGFALFRLPWAVFLMALGLLAAAWRFLQKDARFRLSALWAAAAFYYAAFLVNTQSQEFRYFFPALVLLFICGAACAGALLHQGLARLRKRRTPPQEPTVEENP